MIIQALGRLRQKDHEFEESPELQSQFKASLGYIARP
jgi:hypothetical protein